MDRSERSICKLILDGRWVTDDYDEEEATEKCKQLEIAPGSIVQEEEVQTQSVPTMMTRGDAAARAANLVPFYSVGGPTTHFGGNGANPAYDAGYGNKRAKLRAMGVTEEDWMFRTAEETRRIDRQLRDMRADRIVPLEGEDARHWVYATENQTDPSGSVKEAKLEVQERKRDGFSVTSAAKEDQDGLTPLPSALDGDVSMDVEVVEEESGIKRSRGGEIIVETEEERLRLASKFNWGLGSWLPGRVMASYEVSRQP